MLSSPRKMTSFALHAIAETKEETESLSVPADNSTRLETASESVKEDESSENLMQKIKDAGVAGAISLAIWEGAFWCFSIPAALIGYQQVTGHWPDLSDKDDLAKLGAEAFAFVNFARFAVPLRVGLALSTTPWVQENIVDKFGQENDAMTESSSPNGGEPTEEEAVASEEEAEAATEAPKKMGIRRLVSLFRRKR